MQRVSVMGLGAMGVRMAARLLEAGHEVTVYNRNAERAAALVAQGARAAATPKEAAASSEIVLSMVTDDDASRAIWTDAETGALGGLQPGAIALESSTLTPQWVRELASEVAARGGHFLDAPVAGSLPQAEAGQLIFLVGGSAETFAQLQPLLALMGGKVLHLGPTGAGATLKLAVNSYFAVQVAALSEIAGLLSRGGFDRQSALELFGAMPITSPALQKIAGLMAQRSYSPLFPIDLVEKDLRYALQTAEQLGAALPSITAAREVFAEAQRAGFGGDNIHGVAQLYDSE